jgi:hypothetical protein
MRKALLTASIILAFSIPAQAKSSYHYYKRHLTHHYSHYLTWRHFRHQHFARRYSPIRNSSLPGPCWAAARQGGPCGCWAGHVLLGTTSHSWHGINLWLANDWLKFPHVSPGSATAAVWPGRHVAPVVPGSYSNGTVVVRDSWSTHRVRTAGLVFVQSPGASKRGGANHLPGGSPL